MQSFLLKTCLGIAASVAVSSCADMKSDLASGSSMRVSSVKKSVELPAPATERVIAKAKGKKRDKHGMPTYKDSERRRYVRTTSYSHMENEPGAPGRMNAAGGILKNGKVRSAAADWSVYPLGTKFRIKGQPYIYEVDDYGSALVGTNTVDIFKPTLKGMRKWGTRKVELVVVQWGSYERSAKILKHRTRYKHCRRMYTSITKKLNSGRYAKAEASEMTKM